MNNPQDISKPVGPLYRCEGYCTDRYVGPDYHCYPAKELAYYDIPDRMYLFDEPKKPAPSEGGSVPNAAMP